MSEPPQQQARVCHACIGERRLKSNIRRQGHVADCDYCGDDHRRSVTIDQLADWVDPIYRMGIGRADEAIIYHGADAPGALRAASFPARSSPISSSLLTRPSLTTW